MSNSEEKKIILKSKDQVIFEIDETVAMHMQKIKHIIEDDCASTITIPLPRVHSKILSKVIEYCKHHVEVIDDYRKLKAFDTELVRVDKDTLLELILAANHLHVEGLLDLTIVRLFRVTTTPPPGPKSTRSMMASLGNYEMTYVPWTCENVFDMVNGKTAEEIMEASKIDNDFTPEEEEKFAGRIKGLSIKYGSI